MMTAVCLALASGFTILLPASPAAADGDPDISLSKSAPVSVLVGEPVTYTLTVTNPAGAAPAFNLSLRDVLPAGMTDVPGSTTPADVGDPTLIADQPALRQSTLIWGNVADPPANGSYTLTLPGASRPGHLPCRRVRHQHRRCVGELQRTQRPPVDRRRLRAARPGLHRYGTPTQATPKPRFQATAPTAVCPVRTVWSGTSALSPRE